MSDMVLGSLLVGAFIVGCFFLGIVQQKWKNRQSASQLSPLARMVDGAVDTKNGWLQGTYQGRKLRITTGADSTASGEVGIPFHALKIEVLDLPGQQFWNIEFAASGLFGSGAFKPRVVTRDSALQKRLEATSILEEVSQVGSSTKTYLTVEYNALKKTLVYTDDISPLRVPTQDQFARQLVLAGRLADLNQQVNT